MRISREAREKAVRVLHDALVKEFEIAEDKIRPEARLNEDLGLDSLDGIDMIVLLETELGVAIDDDDIERSKKMKTLGQLTDFVAGLVERGPAARA